MKTNKKLFPVMIAVGMLGSGILYQNCGQMTDRSIEGQNLSGTAESQSLTAKSESLEGENSILVTLKDGTKVTMVERPKVALAPIQVTLKDGTIVHLTPKN